LWALICAEAGGSPFGKFRVVTGCLPPDSCGVNVTSVLP